jgi:hypothetical protein
MFSKTHQRPHETFSYRADKQLWSITPDFPENSLFMQFLSGKMYSQFG